MSERPPLPADATPIGRDWTEYALFLEKEYALSLEASLREKDEWIEQLKENNVVAYNDVLGRLAGAREQRDEARRHAERLAAEVERLKDERDRQQNWIDSVAEALREKDERIEALEEALRRIKDNAVSWHGAPANRPARALAVIAQWVDQTISPEPSEGKPSKPGPRWPHVQCRKCGSLIACPPSSPPEQIAEEVSVTLRVKDERIDLLQGALRRLAAHGPGTDEGCRAVVLIARAALSPEPPEGENAGESAPWPYVPEPHDGEHCQVCGRGYARMLYRVPDDLWLQLAPGVNLLCPPCLDERARADGIVLHWEAGRYWSGEPSPEATARAKEAALNALPKTCATCGGEGGWGHETPDGYVEDRVCPKCQGRGRR